MSKKQDIFDDESLEKESPLLHSIPKENPFSVPENYFESLPSVIIDKCRTNQEPKKWGLGILNALLGYKWRVLTAAGCMAVICFFAIRANNRPTSYEAMANSIPDSLIVEHLDKNINYISEASLEEIYEGQGAGTNTVSVKSVSDSANSDQEIIAYLMDNNVSVTDIENE